MVRWLRSPLFWILILAGFLRLYQLGSLPPGFFRDEAAKGYNAYCLLKTGRDIDNKFLPVFTREFTVYNSALPTYLIVPSILIFGLTEFATRFPFALAGILTILATYLLVARLYSQRAGYIAAFLLAISPWHLLFSRWANQGILLPLFITFGLYCWIRAVDTTTAKNRLWLMGSLLIFAMSLYTYDIAKVFIPLCLLGLLVIYRDEIRRDKRYFLIGLGCFLLLLIPLVWFGLSAPGLSQERFNRISIFAQNRSFWNSGLLFLNNYIQHFSPNFLFISGDNNPRHSAGGIVYLFEIPFLIYGIYLLLKKRTKTNKLFLWWLLIFPIPASLTNEGIPHALRTICALPVFSICSAIGLEKCLVSGKILFSKSVGYRILRMMIMLLFIFSMLNFSITYFYLYPIESPLAWQYGWRDAVKYLDSIKSNYSEIVVSPSFGYPHSFILFYNKVPPHSWQGNEWNIPPYRFDIPDSYMVNERQYSADSSTLFVLPSSQFMTIPVRGQINYTNGQKAIVFLSK
ncbi:MAG: glycosyltransferase family 39 protein [bacterium]|nr:glycosyltransferase family 39 protein [bacterium]